MAIWVLQVEEPPLQHAALPDTSLHYRGECIILREPQGALWGEAAGSDPATVPLSHRQMPAAPLLRPEIPGHTDQPYQLS